MKLLDLTISALKNAYEVHEKLGKNGLEKLKKNRFGETALRGDFQAEEAVLNVLRVKKVPIRVISEEHGVVDIVKNPVLLGILDGLDGSNRYEAYWKGDKNARYGTMFAIFDSINPRYEDYLTSGIMEHPTKRLFIAAKGRGAFLVSLTNSAKSGIEVSKETDFSNKTKVEIDAYEKAAHFPFIKRVFIERLPKGINFKCLLSTAVHYADLASGAADIVLECTYKGNLESAVAYGLVTEAGGVMVDINGESFSKKRYLEFGQKEHVPIITAATKELADSFIKTIS
ncbi:MAG: inositol monophosphatase family protein [Candidatus Levyibacteriota bacterium]